MEELTAKEAIEQGYTYFVFEGLGDQALNYISDITDEDYDNDPVLCDKKPTHPSCPDPKWFRNLIIDHLYDDNSDDSYFDLEMYEDALKCIDFTEILSQIGDQLKGLNYYKGINIKLIRE